MSIIRYGSLADFSAAPAAPAIKTYPALAGVRTFANLDQAIRVAQPLQVHFPASNSARGLALKSLKLTRGFEGFIGNLFNATNHVYFLAWAWDFSGQLPVVYPNPNTISSSAPSTLIPLTVGDAREFLGAGIVLFPARIVTAGLAVRIVLWASHQDARDFGDTLGKVGQAINGSELSNLLRMLASAEATAAIIDSVADAATKLVRVIGAILHARSNDYVDFYEGYYPATDTWTAGDETHAAHASEICLTRFT